jgi:hypothetical protein
VSDALAEFIDNSLQAMQAPGAGATGKAASSSSSQGGGASSSASRRLIEIKIFFDEGRIVIADK